MDIRAEREKRLAEALRENLRRRKAQQRAPAPLTGTHLDPEASDESA
jgi:hypothetical protein